MMKKAPARGHDKLESLMAEHRALDARVAELEKRSYLSPAEQDRMRELKKLKLAKKDLIASLQRTGS